MYYKIRYIGGSEAINGPWVCDGEWIPGDNAKDRDIKTTCDKYCQYQRYGNDGLVSTEYFRFDLIEKKFGVDCLAYEVINKYRMSALKGFIDKLD